MARRCRPAPAVQHARASGRRGMSSRSSRALGVGHAGSGASTPSRSGARTPAQPRRRATTADEIPQRTSTHATRTARSASGDPDGGGWAQVVARRAGLQGERHRTEDQRSDPVEPTPLANAARGALRLGATLARLRASLTSRRRAATRDSVRAPGALSLGHRVALALPRSPSGATGIRRRVGRGDGAGEPVLVSGVERRSRSSPTPADRAIGERPYGARAESWRCASAGSWVTAAESRGTRPRAPARVFDSTFVAATRAQASGLLRGRQRAGLARRSGRRARVRRGTSRGLSAAVPARVELYLAPRWLKRFPAATSASSCRCDTTTGRRLVSAGSGPLVAPAQSRAGHSLVEIRIVNAVIFWQPAQHPRSDAHRVRARLHRRPADAALRRAVGLLELTMSLRRRNLRDLP